jgi:hypothetical protein
MNSQLLKEKTRDRSSYIVLETMPRINKLRCPIYTHTYIYNDVVILSEMKKIKIFLNISLDMPVFSHNTTNNIILKLRGRS